MVKKYVKPGQIITGNKPKNKRESAQNKAGDELIRRIEALRLETEQKKAKQKPTKAKRALPAQKNRELMMKLFKGELVLTKENERAIPSDFVRCGLFSVKNHKEKRELYPTRKPLIIEVMGGGRIKFTGEELRQDDAAVWMELVDMAQKSQSETVTFRPSHFLKSLKWPRTGPNYERLLDSIGRLRMATLDLYLKDIDYGLCVGLINNYGYSEKDDRYWSVEVFHKKYNFLALYEKLYTKLDKDVRLDVSQGVASWLYSYIASHQDPQVSIETIAKYAMIKLEEKGDELLSDRDRIAIQQRRLREAKRIITSALDELKEKKVLLDYSLKDNVVSIKKAIKYKKPKIKFE